MNPLGAILPFALIIILQQVLSAMKPFQIKDIIGELQKSPSKSYGKRQLSQIVRYVLHHSATSGGTPWSFARYHVEKNGWPGIGYHFVIMPDGTTYQTNALETISYGVENMNTGSVNTCLVGNFEVSKPTAAQINAVVSLLCSFVRWNHKARHKGDMAVPLTVVRSDPQGRIPDRIPEYGARGIRP
jgi:hypothetical protein